MAWLAESATSFLAPNLFPPLNFAEYLSNLVKQERTGLLAKHPTQLEEPKAHALCSFSHEKNCRWRGFLAWSCAALGKILCRLNETVLLQHVLLLDFLFQQCSRNPLVNSQTFKEVLSSVSSCQNWYSVGRWLECSYSPILLMLFTQLTRCFLLCYLFIAYCWYIFAFTPFFIFCAVSVVIN